MTHGQWQFWIDRGGTFTDVVARDPQGNHSLYKALSDDPRDPRDAAERVIRRVLGVPDADPIPADQIAHVKMGTTVATNALLERKGAPTALVMTRGFADALIIGDQTRPSLFARYIVRPPPIAQWTLETAARMSASGDELSPVDMEDMRQQLQDAYEEGARSVAIALLHGYRYPIHEKTIAAIARSVGYRHVSVSHEVSPTIKLIPRADTTATDATLTPVLARYVQQLAGALGAVPLWFMQSSGQLTDAASFRGRNSVLSGPAGGVVAAVRCAQDDGADRLIGFDMGGTSTDVFHYAGAFERTTETTVAGARLRTPMMDVHTVAAGGGSICRYEGLRFRVGPDSAGADPGPIAYRNGGPLTVTDCNIVLGRIQPNRFPQIFGASGTQPLDSVGPHEACAAIAAQMVKDGGMVATAESVANGFLSVAVEHMARAIRRVSIERGHDVTDYTLMAYGGAGGQHACPVADALGIQSILIHPGAGVLSALGMGLAEQGSVGEQTVNASLDASGVDEAQRILTEQTIDAVAGLQEQGVLAETIHHTALIRRVGTDASLPVVWGTCEELRQRFAAIHQERYGFAAPSGPLTIDAVRVTVAGPSPPMLSTTVTQETETDPQTVRLWVNDDWSEVAMHQRHDLRAGQTLTGPAVVCEDTGTIVVDADWSATVLPTGTLQLQRTCARQTTAVGTGADPIRLSVFNHRFMAIAEAMGLTLEHTSQSVNIKERRDYSCALFDARGRLVANAPHIPVHLGSMGQSVRAMMTTFGDTMRPGDAYLVNDPYGGGTHLPDLTVVSPVFLDETSTPLFYVASRGHHADVGGITPGSMPAHSTTIDEEGVLFHAFPLVTGGEFHEQPLRAALAAGPHPARKPDQNVADLQAQVAANHRGIQELTDLNQEFGLETVQAYMQHVYDNAAESVRRLLPQLNDGQFSCPSDDGAQINVQVHVDREARTATVDWTGTSAQQPGNANAPTAICRAVVLTVFRTLVAQDIPLNDGCLEPIQIVVPPQSMLDPAAPAAVVAGNVETSQLMADTLLAALGAQAGSQGTMNNLTFGNDTHQYYETLAGGSGAGPQGHGTDAVHSHMTNSRLTDPEILETRYPVRVEHLSVRQGSGGAGQFSGGNGLHRRLRFLEPMTVSLLAGRRQTAPHGLAGGQAGKPGHDRIIRADGRCEPLSARSVASLEVDDMLDIQTPGGGGYGAPS